MSTHSSDPNQTPTDTSQIQQMATVIHNIGNALTGMNSALRHTSQSQADLQRICSWLQGIDSESLDAKQLQEVITKLTTSLTNIVQSADNPHNLALNNDRLLTGASHIKATINSYQDSRKEAQEKQHFELHEAIHSAMAMLVLNQVSVTLDCREAINLYGPHNLFIQMLLNLLKNSIEAMQQRQQQETDFQSMLFIQAKTTQDKINLVITDNGCGVPQQALNKLFEQGYTSKETGTGLGLGSVARTLALFNGHIDITSPGHNQGTSIHISLPTSN